MDRFTTSAVPVSGDITRLLLAIENGDPDAAEKLVPLVYAELRVIAGRVFRREKPGHLLQPTTLVHDAFLKLTGGKRLSLKNRAHFFAVAARAMRQVLISYARGRDAQRRGAGDQALALDDGLAYSPERPDQLRALDDALNHLEQMNERQARIVEMRFFAGMSNKEIAEALQVSITTVKNDWDLAKAWLRRELER